jgi:hypothetical protein
VLVYLATVLTYRYRGENTLSDYLNDGGLDLTFNAGVNWATANIHAVGVSSGYTPSAADSFLTAITSGNRMTSSVAISGASFTGRKFLFSPLLFPAVTAGHVIVGVQLYISTGTDSTSRLLMWVDTSPDLPVTATGADVSFSPDGTLGLFSL